MSLYLGTTPIANDGSHNTANVDLSNLSNTGEAHFANPALTNSPYTTNRILEIPQDIKLELNEGKLTLKAGSKVYVPNGSGNFDIITTTSDFIADTSAYSGLYVLGISTTNGLPNGVTTIQDCVSGGTAPSSPTSLQGWYDITNNVISRYSGGSIQTSFRCSFPLCSVTSNGTNITSIDQVFNGFGYIGSTTFILPGVKWQRCAQSVNYGKNADGTNASEIHSTSSVLLVNHPDTITSTHYICVADGGGAARYTSRGSKIVYYDESKNAWYNDYSETYVYIIPLLEEHTTAGRVDSFTPYSVDSVVNSNASNFSKAGRSYLSGIGMPSNRYIALTLGASQSTYTAPANGWFVLLTSGLTYLDTYRSSDTFGSISHPNNAFAREFVPMQKGQSLYVYYEGTPTNTDFRFYYAEGEE